MKQSLLILSLLLTLIGTKAHATTATCDLAKAENEVEIAQKDMISQIKAAMAKNEKAGVNMDAYLLKVDALRACQKIVTPKTVDMCSGFSLWVNKNLTSKFSMERYFEVYQSRKGSCQQNFLYHQFIIRNERGLQILFHQDGSYIMTNVIPGKSSSGIQTGRSYMFIDGETKGNASTYVIDFPEPLDSYDISLFWGLTIPMNDANAKLELSYSGNDITFEWSNGAYVTIDSLGEQITESNFLAPVSYKPVCTTDQDTSPKGKARLFPKVELLSGSTQYVGTPTLNQ